MPYGYASLLASSSERGLVLRGIANVRLLFLACDRRDSVFFAPKRTKDSGPFLNNEAKGR